jgi:hypothetical protein
MGTIYRKGTTWNVNMRINNQRIRIKVDSHAMAKYLLKMLEKKKVISRYQEVIKRVGERGKLSDEQVLAMVKWKDTEYSSLTAGEIEQITNVYNQILKERLHEGLFGCPTIGSRTMQKNSKNH